MVCSYFCKDHRSLQLPVSFSLFSFRVSLSLSLRHFHTDSRYSWKLPVHRSKLFPFLVSIHIRCSYMCTCQNRIYIDISPHTTRIHPRCLRQNGNAINSNVAGHGNMCIRVYYVCLYVRVSVCVCACVCSVGSSSYPISPRVENTQGIFPLYV